ncbi:hypothetical protein EV07_0195 [Prochlorococcus sp. MIT 0603]|nr:hypothetical protein EV07_0195 [Prochlorococcus sp. MIT 0603]
MTPDPKHRPSNSFAQVEKDLKHLNTSYALKHEYEFNRTQ